MSGKINWPFYDIDLGSRLRYWLMKIGLHEKVRTTYPIIINRGNYIHTVMLYLIKFWKNYVGDIFGIFFCKISKKTCGWGQISSRPYLILGIVGSIDTKRKVIASIQCWANYVTTFDLTHVIELQGQILKQLYLRNGVTGVKRNWSK